MADADRRRRFVAYFEREFKGDRARLMERSGYTHGRISHFFDNNQAFGERAASNLALRLGLPVDFFEQDESRRLGADALAVALEYDSLTADEKLRFRLLLQAARGPVRAAPPCRRRDDSGH